MATQAAKEQSDAAFLMADAMTHTERVNVAPWVPVYIALMVRIAQSDRFKATLATFVIYHGMENEP